MSLDRDAVRNVAHLARLDLREADVGVYAQQLSEILKLVDQLGAADTAGITPMAHPLDAVQRVRPDEVAREAGREDYLDQAPAVEHGLYLVPTVIE